MNHHAVRTRCCNNIEGLLVPLLSIVLGILVVAISGCKEPSRISQYDVPKSQSDMDRFTVIETERKPGSGKSDAPAEPSVPEGWTPGGSGSFGVRNKFSKEVDGQKVEVSISTLPARAAIASDWHQNVNRWAGSQLGLKIEPEAIDEQTVEVKVDGTAGKMIRLFDEKSNEGKAIIAAMIIEGENVWFFKSIGKAEAVEATEAEFNDYLKSFKFP